MCPLTPNINRDVSTGLFEKKTYMAFIGHFGGKFYNGC